MTVVPTTSGNTDTRQGIIDAAQRIMAHKGYAAVGINEVLAEAKVPKGSFYHYFSSKDAFGEAVMKSYFHEYLADMDRLLKPGGRSAAERLMAYWRQWHDTQSLDDCNGRCLAVKLGAEVADLSESMRLVLKEGTTAIVDRVEQVIDQGLRDGSLTIAWEARATAQVLYDMWLGASVLAKIHRSSAPMDTTMTATRRLLGQ
ncbi:TetR/AcrR family transcriptional regulator [Umezawaea endophytica]|uniref:TetR/AcrR family transcriptional regulator n=1 Tax=Umezawaea endophytica TaxID=1654476 RepID=A0A9X3A0N1_9PSEU|nr:TetR/AcrR family transcriptional regulator [Umezawaea endophytica]MCS7478724.1 TetR/AcrR family transcriptional regulator [Umezawaea endophytica]